MERWSRALSCGLCHIGAAPGPQVASSRERASVVTQIHTCGAVSVPMSTHAHNGNTYNHTLTHIYMDACTQTYTHMHTPTHEHTYVHKHTHRLPHSCSAFTSSERLCLSLPGWGPCPRVPQQQPATPRQSVAAARRRLLCWAVHFTHGLSRSSPHPHCLA